MKGTVSQRELRKDHAEGMRSVEAGESFIVTRRGAPSAHLGPIPATSDLACAQMRSLDALQLAGVVRIDVDAVITCNTRMQGAARSLGTAIVAPGQT